MKSNRLISLAALLLSCVVASSASYNYRYWFDADDSQAVTGTMVGKRLNLTPNVSALSSTVHSFNIQVQDANGYWTAPVVTHFVKLHQTATKGYYWFDNDSTFSHETSITDGTMKIDVTGLTEGVHSFHYAAMTADGLLTGVVTRWFVRAPLPEESHAMRCAWSFDGGETHVSDHIVVDGKTLHLDLDVLKLSYGRHRLDIILLDENGHATNNVMSYFVVIEPDPMDVNGDGEVNSADITALYSLLLDNIEVVGNADVNNDGTINGADITALYNYLLGN